MRGAGGIRDKKPSHPGVGGLAVNIAVVVAEAVAALCGYKGCTVPCTCVCALRDGAGRGDPCDLSGLRGHMHLRCRNRIYNRPFYIHTHLPPWCIRLSYDLINHTHRIFLHFPLSLSLCPLLPLDCALSSVFSLLEENHSLFSPASLVHFCLVLFVEAQWSVTYWPLDRFQTTHCSCGYRIDVGAGTVLLQITHSAFSV